MPWRRTPEVQREYNYKQVLKKLIAKGDLVKARAYAEGKGLDMPGEAPPVEKPLWQVLQEAALYEEAARQIPKRVFEPVLRQEHAAAVAGKPVTGIYDDGPPNKDWEVRPQLRPEGPLPPPGPGEPVVYPDFKVARDPLPAGVVYAELVSGFLNPLMRRIRFESGEHGVLWITRKQGARVRIGDTVPVTDNPDNMQQGWVIWRPART